MPSESTKQPVLSIIMPVYNAEKYVEQAIQSIIDQTFQRWELFICDDGSNDNTWEIINRFYKRDIRIKITRNNSNIGKTQTVNNLFSRTTGKFLTIHDADDFSHPNRFTIQCSELMYKDIALCGCNFNNVNVKSEVIKIKHRSEVNFQGPTIVFKRDVVEKVGGLYRDVFIVAEDTDFIERVKENFKVSYVKEKLYNYRWSSNTLTKSTSLYIPERYAIYDLLDFLKNERMQNGTDSLMNGNVHKVDHFLREKISLWKSKEDEIIRDGINRSIYFQLHRNAFILSLKYVYIKPLEIIPYKYLITTLFNYIKS